jgi:universal stress protein A
MSVRRILCATDFSPASGPPWAFAQRLRRSTGAELLLLHVVLPGSAAREAAGADPVYGRAREDDERQALAALGRFAEFAMDPEAGVTLRVDRGPASARILAVAEEEAVDLVVVGTHGRTGLDRLVLGSVAEDVVAQATCPVVTVRPLSAAPDVRHPLRRVLYAVEGPAAPRRALPWATAIAQAAGGSLEVLEVEMGAAEFIVRYAEAREADLIVVDTMLDGSLPGVTLGGTMRRVLHTAPCPVLTVGPAVVPRRDR